MKKIVITIIIVLSVSFSASAQWGGGLFQYGEVSEDDYYGSVWFALNQNNALQREGGLLMPSLPSHSQSDNQNAPLGGGAFLLIGFGAAYALRKRKNYCE